MRNCHKPPPRYIKVRQALNMESTPVGLFNGTIEAGDPLITNVTPCSRFGIVAEGVTPDRASLVRGSFWRGSDEGKSWVRVYGGVLTCILLNVLVFPAPHVSVAHAI